MPVNVGRVREEENVLVEIGFLEEGESELGLEAVVAEIIRFIVTLSLTREVARLRPQIRSINLL